MGVPSAGAAPGGTPGADGTVVSPAPISPGLPLSSAPPPMPSPSPSAPDDGAMPSASSTTPGALPTESDNPIVTDSADPLLFTGPSNGLTNPFTAAQGGWSAGPQIGPMVADAIGNLYAYAGSVIDSFSGAIRVADNPNAFTGGQNIEPFSGVPTPVVITPADASPPASAITENPESLEDLYQQLTVQERLSYLATAGEMSESGVSIAPGTLDPTLARQEAEASIPDAHAPLVEYGRETDWAQFSTTNSAGNLVIAVVETGAPEPVTASGDQAAASGAPSGGTDRPATFQWNIMAATEPAPPRSSQPASAPTSPLASAARSNPPQWEMTPWGPMQAMRYNANGELEVVPQISHGEPSITAASDEAAIGGGYRDMMFDMRVISRAASPGGAPTSLGSLRAAASLARGGNVESAMHQIAVGNAITQGLGIAVSLAVPSIAAANKTSLALPGPGSIATPSGNLSTIGSEGLLPAGRASAGLGSLLESAQISFPADTAEAQQHLEPTPVPEDSLPIERIEDRTPTGPSFEGLVDTEALSNDPRILDFIDRAGQIDIASYDMLKARGPGKASDRVGRPGDGLDSDEALQNVFLRESLGVGRDSSATRDNPAMALPKPIHQAIRNLTAAQIQGKTPNQVLQFHLNQMQAAGVPEYAVRALEIESQRFIIQTFGSLY